MLGRTSGVFIRTRGVLGQVNGVLKSSKMCVKLAHGFDARFEKCIS